MAIIVNGNSMDKTVPALQVVDLPTVTATELEALWQREGQWWRQQLFWDIADGLATLRRLVGRRQVPGKVVQVDGESVGYAYYVTIDRLGILAGLSIAPAWSTRLVGETLLSEALAVLRQDSVFRIESQCIAIDCPWLPTAFAQEGFETFWRQFLRLDIATMRLPVPGHPQVHIEPWRHSSQQGAAAIMQAAYSRSVDARMSLRYRSLTGCGIVLDQLLNQGGCGRVVTDASGLASTREQAVGFIIITEISPHQAHLAQVIVSPSYQGRGIGRFLVNYSLAQLARQGFDTLSLIVSEGNQRALALYQSMGFTPVCTFPMFAWEQAGAITL